MNLSELKSRDDIGAWLTTNGMTGSAVEIGVYDGANAVQILSNWPGTLHLVDPWERQDPSVYIESPHIDFPSVESLAIERMLPFGNRAVFHKTTSDAAFIEMSQDGVLMDFIYIDGNHAREQVEIDVRNWWTMVKPGGILGGHDYVDGLDAVKAWHCAGIKPAVDAFAATLGLQVHVTHGPWPPSWWIKKPAAK